MAFRVTSPAFSGGFATVPALSSAEATVAGYAELDLWLSARFPAADRLTRALQDGVGQVVFADAGSALYGNGINGKPTLCPNRNADGHMIGAYQVPATYSIASLVRFNTLNISNAILASADSDGDRLFFGTTSAGKVYYAHNTSSSNAITSTASVVVDTNYVLWASYDASDKSAAIGINKLTATHSATWLADHKGQTQTGIGVCRGAQTFDGHIAEVLVFDTPLHKSANDAKRTATLNMLAALGGVTLAA